MNLSQNEWQPTSFGIDIGLIQTILSVLTLIVAIYLLRHFLNRFVLVDGYNWIADRRFQIDLFSFAKVVVWKLTVTIQIVAIAHFFELFKC